MNLRQHRANTSADCVVASFVSFVLPFGGQKLSRSAVPEGNPLVGLLLTPPNPLTLGFGGVPKIFSARNAPKNLEIHKVFLRFYTFF